MKAWQFYSLSDMRLEEVPYPAPPPGWVTVKVRTVQASVSETILARGLPTSGAEEKIKKLFAEKTPLRLFGHEFSAEVVELGEGVREVAVGDRVSAISRVPCGSCRACQTGHRELCRKGLDIGRDVPGAFAEYLTLPAEILIKLPDSVTDSDGASLQPLTSCVPTVADAGISMGETVVVIGQGVMGLFCMQIARYSGAGLVIGIDVRDQSLRLSKELSADVVIDARVTDPVQAVLEATGGNGAEVILEAAGGSPAHGLAGTTSLLQALDMVADGGRIVEVALLGGLVSVPIWRFRSRSINYIFPKSPTRRQMEHAVALVASKRVRIAPLVTHTLQGLDKVPEAFEITANKTKYDAIGPAQVVVSR